MAVRPRTEAAGFSLPNNHSVMDIRLDAKFVLYRGFEGTTGPQCLRGSIVFNTEAVLKPRHIELSLHRIQRTEHHVLSYERSAG